MSPVLFRARLKDKEEWVYGLLWGPDYMVDDETRQRGFDREYELMPVRDIDEGTLSQFTGYRDRNGEKIFVGDILEAGNGEKGMVQYDLDKDLFVVSGFGSDCMSFDFMNESVEIIGNVYEKMD